MKRNNYYLNKMWKSSNEIIKITKYSVTKRISKTYAITTILTTIIMNYNNRNIISDIDTVKGLNIKPWRRYDKKYYY